MSKELDPNTPFASQEELTAAIRAPLYKDTLYGDHYRETVHRKLALMEGADPSEVNLEQAMVGPVEQWWQDRTGDLDKDQSCYHTLLEAQADAANPRYKVDPYFREQVARKLQRSLPDAEAGRLQHHDSSTPNTINTGDAEEGQ